MDDINANMTNCDLTVVIPCYNEERTISITLQKVLNELNSLKFCLK
jgi:glycosyltransferase involved in cell wall biosynthesis